MRMVKINPDKFTSKGACIFVCLHRAPQESLCVLLEVNYDDSRKRAFDLCGSEPTGRDEGGRFGD